MTRAELDTVVEWAAREGWNPGVHDATAFYPTDPSGFYVGVLDGEVIASISAVKYGSKFAFVGYYIVLPEHRGKGYGLRLWEHAMRDIEGVSSGLDGVLAQAANYERSGYATAYHNVRYAGANPSPNPLTVDEEGATWAVSSLADDDFDAVVAYDASIFPATREHFLSLWLKQPEAKVLVIREAGAIVGYGVVRPARNGWRVGPLFADGAGWAEALLDVLVSLVPSGQPVFIDVPQVNDEAIALVRSRGMTPMFETARMYRGGAPAVDVGRVFGVTSLELG
jgi:ribosomal protein S18 acetylase RimI-like enzyme